jgi:hypothetical protein
VVEFNFGTNYKPKNEIIMKKIVLISAMVLFVASFSFVTANVVTEKAPSAQVDDDKKKEKKEDCKKDSSCEKKEENCEKKKSSECN